MKLHIPIKRPVRDLNSLSYEERFGTITSGLVTSWEIGRKLATKDPELAAKACNRELPILSWRGGVEKRLKTGVKIGVFYYLAQWQGLREEDLSIDIEKDVTIVCSKTGVAVTFTSNNTLLMEQEE